MSDPETKPMSELDVLHAIWAELVVMRKQLDTLQAPPVLHPQYPPQTWPSVPIQPIWVDLNRTDPYRHGPPQTWCGTAPTCGTTTG